MKMFYLMGMTSDKGYFREKYSPMNASKTGAYAY